VGLMPDEEVSKYRWNRRNWNGALEWLLIGMCQGLAKVDCISPSNCIQLHRTAPILVNCGIN
jgi:hypothetical protein